MQNTQQITRAMKFVSAAKLRRAQENALSARPYARQILRVLRSAIARIEHPIHPLLARREGKCILLLSVSGDKGLCGAFNTNILRKSLEFLRERSGLKIQVIPIGKKSRDALRKRNVSFVAEYPGIFSKVQFAHAKQISDRVSEMYTSGQVDTVYAIFNEFKSVLAQRLLVEKLLPIDPEVFAANEQGNVPAQVDYIYEQRPADILGQLLPRYLETQVYRLLLESAAAEHAARMTAMGAATENARELVDTLTLHMNKVRQAAITKELIEVVSGAASAA